MLKLSGNPIPNPSFPSPATRSVAVARPEPAQGPSTGRSRKQADLYSLGATLHDIATGEPLSIWFRGCSGRNLDDLIGDGPIDGLEKVAAALMHEDPQRRPTLDEVLQMPYFTVQGGLLPGRQVADELKKIGFIKEASTPRPSFSGASE